MKPPLSTHALLRSLFFERPPYRMAARSLRTVAGRHLVVQSYSNSVFETAAANVYTFVMAIAPASIDWPAALPA